MIILTYWKAALIALLSIIVIVLFYRGRVLKAENAALTSDIAKQTIAIQDLQTNLTQCQNTANSRIEAKDATIERIRKICGRKIPIVKTGTQTVAKNNEGEKGNAETPIDAGSTIDLLNGMFGSR